MTSSLQRHAHGYCTAIVTVFDVTPPTLSARFTASPLGTSSGICTLTTNSPTSPGDTQEYVELPWARLHLEGRQGNSWKTLFPPQRTAPLCARQKA